MDFSKIRYLPDAPLNFLRDVPERLSARDNHQGAGMYKKKLFYERRKKS